MIECKICNKEFKKTGSLATHLKFSHNKSYTEYKVEFDLVVEIPKCLFCNNKCKVIDDKRIRKTCCSKECILKENQTRIIKDEYREFQRKKRFDYLKLKTGKTAWERRNRGEMSYLEEWFYNNCILKYELDKLFKIKNEFSIYPYFIDFAFIDLNIAVELDGRCHFVNKRRIDHDFKKDTFLKEKGWNVFRISYKENNEEKIKEFLNILSCSGIGNTSVFDTEDSKFEP